MSYLDFPAKAILVKDSSEKVNFQIKYIIVNHKGFSDICYKDFKDFENSIQIYQVALNKNQFIGEIITEIQTGEQTQKQRIKVISIENNFTVLKEIDKYQSYSIKNYV